VNIKDYLENLQQLKLNNPVLVGFGIKDKTTFQTASDHANGAIIGTAYINAIGKSNDVNATTRDFLQSILG
jgi:tryptophan synthase alpha chain